MPPFETSTAARLHARWRLFLPMLAIGTIVAIAASLLLVSHIFERDRQEQRLISETLWAEQALSYEFERLMEGLQLIGRMAIDVPHAEGEFRVRGAAAMQRSPEITFLYRLRADGSGPWIYPVPAATAAAGQAAAPAEIAAAAHRALQLNRPTAGFSERAPSTLILAVPGTGDARGATAVVAEVSLNKLLESTIPWWFAHEAQINIDDSSGGSLAVRDSNVVGRGIYRHKIATQLADQTVYLTANSSRGTPFLVPNVLTLSVICLSMLLAWTVYALWRDLALRTRTEASLREQRAFQQAMENSLLTGLRARDMEGRVTYVNPALCVMLGCSRDDLIGMLPSRPPAEGTEKAFESVLYRRDGSRVDVLLHEAPLLDGSGHQAGWMASILDISEQKRNAEVVRQQNDRMHRMSRVMTMGEMASALAHELNQPLTALTSYLSAALNVLQASPRGATPEETFGTLVKAKQQADRAGAIIRRVRQFVRKSGPVLVEIDLNELLSDVLPLVKLQTGDLGEEVALRVDRHLPPVVGDRVLLEQVLLNLTKNAFEAMMHLDVTQRRIVIFIETDAADPSIVVVGVRDHGGGLPDGGAHILTSTLSTTKPDGMGMGLAICRTALEFMGSRLVYTQADGGGADFRFSLPVASFHAS